MSLPEVLANFRARNVTFELKDGTKRTIFVNEIEDEDDDQPEMIFMADDPKDDVFISQVVDAIPGSANFSLAIHQMPYCELKFVLKGKKAEFKLKDGAIKTFIVTNVLIKNAAKTNFTFVGNKKEDSIDSSDILGVKIIVDK